MSTSHSLSKLAEAAAEVVMQSAMDKTDRQMVASALHLLGAKWDLEDQLRDYLENEEILARRIDRLVADNGELLAHVEQLASDLQTKNPATDRLAQTRALIARCKTNQGAIR